MLKTAIETNLLLTGQFCTKGQLYEKIKHIRGLLSLKLDKYPINIYETLDKVNHLIDYEEQDFDTSSFKGILLKSDYIKSKLILNKNLTIQEKSFAVAHELIHFFCHPKQTKFMCSPLSAKINDIYEWQANEGAAELYLPYEFFLVDWKETLDYYKKPTLAIKALAKVYKLSEKVIEYRLQSLRYESFQYLNGKSLNEIKILSQAEHKKLYENKQGTNDLCLTFDGKYYNTVKLFLDGNHLKSKMEVRSIEI